MSSTHGSSYPVHVDERGALLAVEFDEVAHPVRRVFVVSDSPAGAVRGEHRVACGETAVLLAGGATFWIDDESHRLEAVGDRLDLRVGAELRYRLDGPDSMLLVLAEKPYAEESDES